MIQSATEGDKGTSDGPVTSTTTATLEYPSLDAAVSAPWGSQKRLSPTFAALLAVASCRAGAAATAEDVLAARGVARGPQELQLIRSGVASWGVAHVSHGAFADVVALS